MSKHNAPWIFAGVAFAWLIVLAWFMGCDFDRSPSTALVIYLAPCLSGAAFFLGKLIYSGETP